MRRHGSTHLVVTTASLVCQQLSRLLPSLIADQSGPRRHGCVGVVSRVHFTRPHDPGLAGISGLTRSGDPRARAPITATGHARSTRPSIMKMGATTRSNRSTPSGSACCPALTIVSSRTSRGVAARLYKRFLPQLLGKNARCEIFMQVASGWLSPPARSHHR